VDELIKYAGVLTAIVGVLTLIKVVDEYRNSQKWKRLEFLANEARLFFDNPVNKRALLMLDWDKKIIVFDGPKSLSVDWDLITQSLIPEDKKQDFNNEEQLIRDTFSEFFDNLSRFEHYIKSGLFSQNEFREYIIYWTNQIHKDITPELRKTVFDFLTYYKYTSVLDLLKRYERN